MDGNWVGSILYSCHPMNLRYELEYLCVGIVALPGRLGQYMNSCFFVLCFYIPILSFRITTETDTFPFKLIHFYFQLIPF